MLISVYGHILICMSEIKIQTSISSILRANYSRKRKLRIQ